MGAPRLCLCLGTLAVLCLRECFGQNESNCSFYYFFQPLSTIDCNPLGINVPLACGVYVSRDSPTTVRWYWTESGDLAGVNGTWITDGSPGYNLVANPSTDPIMNGMFVGLFYEQYGLTILSFSANNLGYYWCQIIINDTVLLKPSQILNISVPDASSSQCLSNALLFNDFREDCAENDPQTPLLQPASASTMVNTIPVLLTLTTAPTPEISTSPVTAAAIESPNVPTNLAAVVSETPSILTNLTDPTYPTNATELFVCCDITVYISIGIAIPIGMLVIICFGILAVNAVCITREMGRKGKMRKHKRDVKYSAEMDDDVRVKVDPETYAEPQQTHLLMVPITETVNPEATATANTNACAELSELCENMDSSLQKSKQSNTINES